MDKNKFYEPPINWSDYEDIALALYEKFGDDFSDYDADDVDDDVDGGGDDDDDGYFSD